MFEKWLIDVLLICSDGFSFPYLRPSNSGRGVPRDGVSGVSGPLIKISEATVGASMAE